MRPLVFRYSLWSKGGKTGEFARAHNSILVPLQDKWLDRLELLCTVGNFVDLTASSTVWQDKYVHMNTEGYYAR